MSVHTLMAATGPSKHFMELVASIAKTLNLDVHDLAERTLAEIVCMVRGMPVRERVKESVNKKTGEIKRMVFVDDPRKLRGPARLGKNDGRSRVGLLTSKVHQSDLIRELRRIFEMQGLSNELLHIIITKVFQAKSPKGSAKERVARDDLDKTQYRAEKASLAFQRYRIVTILCNLRVQEQSGQRALTSHERMACLEFLWNPVDDRGQTMVDVGWADVAQRLGVTRASLKGTAGQTEDGERASARPPVNVTGACVRACGVKDLILEWDSADEAYQEALVEMLGNGSGSGANRDEVSRAEEFIADLPEDQLAKLDAISVPEGRAAYSVKTLRRLTQRMLTTEDDLHAARKAIFDVPDDWKPTPPDMGEPVGNPAVDRVLKIVQRYLLACQREWGVPLSVNVEHTRDGLMSAKQARDVDRENNARYDRNRELEADIAAYLNQNGVSVRSGDDDSFEENPDTPLTGQAIGRRKADIDRMRALSRQEGRCLYCGSVLDFLTMEMDHILPRAGAGATNTQVNLAAVCRPCNHSKGKQPFAVWALSGIRPEVSLEDALDRVDGFRFFGIDGDDRRYQARFKKEVKDRLRRSDCDEAIDNRSMESVGWMANELHHRIEAYFAKENERTDRVTTVAVFRGWITSEARRAAGIEDKIMLIGGKAGKNRLDRRHHAIDAATIAMLRQGAAQSLVTQQKAREDGFGDFDIAQILTERDSMHRAYELTTSDYMLDKDDRPRPAWTLYKGSNPELFNAWQSQMRTMADLVQERLTEDGVPVFEFLRLKVGSSSGHEDTMKSTIRARVGDEMSVAMIDRSATPQQWVALTRNPDFDRVQGLPADPARTVRVGSQWLNANDDLEFFPTGAGCVAVRGGYAELGASFHHARIYRCVKTLSSGKAKPFYAMMRVYTLDLLPFRDKGVDVFSVPLPPQCMSHRTAEPKLRDALADGCAEYVGWIVPGDELLLDMSTQTTGAVGTFLQQFPGTCSWVVQGFFAPGRLHLRPRYLAGEGAVSEAENKKVSETRVVVPPSTEKIVSGQGYLPAVNVLFSECNPRIIRRDILGRVRARSAAHLPASWGVGAVSAESSV